MSSAMNFPNITFDYNETNSDSNGEYNGEILAAGLALVLVAILQWNGGPRMHRGQHYCNSAC